MRMRLSNDSRLAAWCCLPTNTTFLVWNTFLERKNICLRLIYVWFQSYRFKTEDALLGFVIHLLLLIVGSHISRHGGGILVKGLIRSIFESKLIKVSGSGELFFELNASSVERRSWVRFHPCSCCQHSGEAGGARGQNRYYSAQKRVKMWERDSRLSLPVCRL